MLLTLAIERDCTQHSHYNSLHDARLSLIESNIKPTDVALSMITHTSLITRSHHILHLSRRGPLLY